MMKKNREYWKVLFACFLMVALTSGVGQAQPTPAPGEALGYILVDTLGGIHTTSPDGPLTSELVAPEIRDLTSEDPANENLPDLFFGWDIVRGLAVSADQDGFWVLDGFGGIWPYGNAQKDLALNSEGALLYFGWDIARDIEAGTDNMGAVVLDGFGAVFGLGSAKSADFLSKSRPYFGWDIARDVEVTPDLGGYVLLDGFGGVHYVGNASFGDPGTPSSYFGWDIARDIEPLPVPGKIGDYILDGFGGLFVRGDAQTAPVAYFGWDIAKDLELLHFPELVGEAEYQGLAPWVLDGFGGIHPTTQTGKIGQSAQAMVQFSLNHYFGFNIARDFEVVNAPGIPDFSTPTPVETATPTVTLTPTGTEFVPTATFTPTLTATVTPTATETEFGGATPTPTPTQEPAPATFDLCSYFPLLDDSEWHYVGNDDDFTWQVLADRLDVDGTPVVRIQTLADETTDDRHLDEDFWYCDTNGDLYYYGIHRGVEETVVEGPPLSVVLPVQDIILNQPLLIGGAGQQIGDVAPGSAEAQIQVEVNGIPQVLNATITSEVQFTRFLDTMNIPGFGEFTNVLRMVINLEITTDINLLGETNFPIYGSTFFLKEGVGMIAHDQEADPDDAQVQLMDSATVGGVEITEGS